MTSNHRPISSQIEAKLQQQLNENGMKADFAWIGISRLFYASFINTIAISLT